MIRTYPASATDASFGLLVLAHGAGAGQSHPFMVKYAQGLSARGLDVATFDFPYMAQRRRSPDRPPVLEAAFREAVAEAVAQIPGRPSTAPRASPDKVEGRRVFIGGKSMGGRMAVRVAAAEQWPSTVPPVSGVIVFGYPLIPPGGNVGDRASHFAHLTVPTMIVQGTRDSFGGPDAVRRAAPGVVVHPVDGGDHSFSVPKSAGRSQDAVHAEIMDAVIAWIRSS